MWSATEVQKVWTTRKPKDSDAKDDVQFEYFGDVKDYQTPGCKVKGKSRSQSQNYYDGGSNYCNMWNIFNEIKDKKTGAKAMDTAKMDLFDCKWQPKDPETDCKKK